MATIKKREGRNGTSYLIRASCGYDAVGRQIMRSMTWRPDPGMSRKAVEKELQRQAVLFEEKCAQGGSAGNVKFETFARSWFDEYANKNLRLRSVDRLHQLEARTYAAIGHIRLDKLNARHIQTFLNDLQEPGTNHNKPQKGLSPKTVRNYHSFISSVLNYAVRMGMLQDNPCRRVSLPPLEHRQKEVYSLEEAQRFLIFLESAPIKYQAFFALAIYGGFRRGEILGLEWKDIDFEHRVISINRTSQAIRGKKPFTDDTKTKESHRSLKLPECVFDVLRKHRADQAQERLRVGAAWHNLDRLFTTWDGEPMRVETPRNWLVKFCQETNQRFLGIHAFRHLNASLLIGAGVDVRTVSASLGHSNTSTTLNIYAHAFAAEQARASEAIAEALKLG